MLDVKTDACVRDLEAFTVLYLGRVKEITFQVMPLHFKISTTSNLNVKHSLFLKVELNWSFSLFSDFPSFSTELMLLCILPFGLNYNIEKVLQIPRFYFTKLTILCLFSRG
jgi:hypothetical protein